MVGNPEGILLKLALMGRHLPSTAGGSPRATVVRAKGALAVLPRNGTRQARHTRLTTFGSNQQGWDWAHQNSPNLGRPLLLFGILIRLLQCRIRISLYHHI